MSIHLSSGGLSRSTVNFRIGSVLAAEMWSSARAKVKAIAKLEEAIALRSPELVVLDLVGHL